MVPRMSTPPPRWSVRQKRKLDDAFLPAATITRTTEYHVQACAVESSSPRKKRTLAHDSYAIQLIATAPCVDRELSEHPAAVPAQEHRYRSHSPQSQSLPLVPNDPNLLHPSVVFPFNAKQRAENGLYHVKVEEIRHVIEDQTGQIPPSLHSYALMYSIITTLMQTMRNTKIAPDGDDTIHLSATLNELFTAALKKSVMVDEAIYNDFIEPWLQWVLAEAGKHFLVSPDCRMPEACPEFYEEPDMRYELMEALEPVLDKHRDWAVDAAQTLDFEIPQATAPVAFVSRR